MASEINRLLHVTLSCAATPFVRTASPHLRRQGVRVSVIAFARACVATCCMAVSVYAQEASTADAADGKEPATRVGWIEISGMIHEGQQSLPFMSDRPDPTVERIVNQLQTVADDATYRGAVVYLDFPTMNLSQVETIGQAIEAVREVDKSVLVFAEAYSTPGYLLACRADQILLQRHGELMLTTLGVEEIYLAGMLEKIGVQADLLQVGRFKGAMDPWTRRDPSAAWTENIDGLLDDLYEQMLATIAQGRGLSRKQVEQLLTEVWTLDDAGYVRRGLVDMVVSRDLVDATSLVFGTSFTWDKAMGYQTRGEQPVNPFALFQSLLSTGRQRVTRDSIVLIHATGPIHAGTSNASGPASGSMTGPWTETSIGSRTLVKVLREAERDARVKGVLLRIDSPGGSALASEIIWQALRSAGAKKPLYVSVGSMAASGGYYLASASQKIYVNETSLLGSIGVVGGKMIVGGLYEKIGLGVYRRSRGPMGDLFNSIEPFTAEQRQIMLASMRRIYDLFLDRVREGRGRRLDDVESVAAGRLFTGRQAVDNGLADVVGSLQRALDDLAAAVGLEPGAYDVVEKPDPPSFGEILEALFGIQASRVASDGATDFQALIGMARAILGPKRWASVAPVLNGMLMLRAEHTLLLLPAAIAID